MTCHNFVAQNVALVQIAGSTASVPERANHVRSLRSYFHALWGELAEAV